MPAIFNTTDSGQTWNPQTFGENEHLYSIYFVDELNGWAVGGTASQSLFVHTGGGGQNWEYQTSPTTAALFNLNFINQNCGWAVGMNGTIIYFEGNATVLEESSESTLGLAANFELLDNYPNPFNPATTIQYANPKNQNVILQIYNILGQEVKTLVNAAQSAGTYSVTWDGTDNFKRQVSSGVYSYQLRRATKQKPNA